MSPEDAPSNSNTSHYGTPTKIAMQSVTPSGPRQQSAASASENQETGGVAHYGNVSFAWCDVF